MAEEEIYRVTCKMARDIIDGSNPERVKVYCEDPDGYFVAVDNSSGEAFTEDFTTGEDAIEWLTSDITAEEIRARHRPKYVPFDLSKEEDRDYLRGKWIISTSGEYQISGFRSFDGEDGEEWMVATTTVDITPESLCSLWRFDDGSPCGKLAEDEE